MEEKRINRNLVLIEAVKNICENCKICEVPAKNRETGQFVTVKAKYCLNGSGYIDINLYDENDRYLDCCKLKHPTDSCLLPFDLDIMNEPNCNCEYQC